MIFPCCNRAGCTWGSYVTTKHFYVAIGLTKARGKCVATKPVYVITKLASVGKLSIVTEYFYIATELVKAKRNYVATEIICVTTELAAIEISVAHDRAGRGQARRTTRTIGAQCARQLTRQAPCERRSSHDRRLRRTHDPVRACSVTTEISLSRQTCPIAKKIKK